MSPRAKPIAAFLVSSLAAALPAAAQDVERDERVPAAATAPATTQADELFQPTRVTLKLMDAEAADAIKQLADAAGLRVGDIAEDVATALKGRRVSPAFDREPLLAALKDLCRQAEVEPVILRQADGKPLLALRVPKLLDPSAPNPAARLQPTGKPWTKCPTHLSGPVMIAVVNATANSYVSPPPQGRMRQSPRVSYNFVMLVEPKLDIVALAPFPQITQIADENGAAIPLPVRQGEPTFRDVRSEQTSFSISFTPPRDDVQRVSLLRGNLRVRTAVRRDTISIPVDLDQPERVPAPDRDKPIAGFRLRVEPLVRGRGIGPNGADTFELRYTIFRDEKSNDEWNKLTNDLTFARPQLVDEQGLALYQLSNRADRKTATELTQSRQLVRAQRGRAERGEPKRVVWSVPVETEEIEIPFEFRDLPVPR